MAIPHAVLAGGWIPFVVVVVLAFIFSWIYIRLFQHHELSEVSSTLASIFGLFITLLTTALVPVDVFLVSFMKKDDGTFKSWAADNATRSSIEDTVTYTYYALYSMVALFAFLILPFMYFYYEEKDDDLEVTTKQRCCSAFKYTLVFMIIAFVILMVGAFVPLKTPASQNVTKFDDKVHFMEDQLAQYTHAEQAMSILVGVMSMFGMITLVMYTGFGMSALPLGMIRCCRKYDEPESNPKRLTRRERDEERARALRAKSRIGRNLTRYERNELRRIEQDEQLQHKISRKKKRMANSCFGRISRYLKPFEVVFGFCFLAISLLMMVSLTITNVDKDLNSFGYKQGYSLPKPKLPNPVNIIMVHASKVFPLDYVLFSGMALFFIFASMNGIKRMGIWCCCIRMYKIRTGRTLPQALLFMVFIMMFMVVGLTIILFTITPQYVQYGSQQYTHQYASGNFTITEVKKCSTEAPKGKCTMSSLAMLLNTLFYKAWFFGAFYHWCIWILIAIYYLSLLFNLANMFRTRDEAEMVSSDEETDSDEERLIKA